MLMNFKFYVKRFLLSLFLVLASTMLYAQKKADITGTVYDSDGTTPAVGCAVTIEGTPTGVITDINGKYKIRGGGGGKTRPSFFLRWVIRPRRY